MITTDTLPDDVLIVIFSFYLDLHLGEYSPEKEREKAWQLLVHVCRRWRTIIFGSPRHLNLQLVCNGRTRARDRLDVWTALPLVIQCEKDDDDYSKDSIRNVDNIIAVLERRNRVCRIDLVGISFSNFGTIFAAMQQPFQELIFLRLWSYYDGMVPVIPDSFLGGSAPRLRYLMFSHIPFPGLPNLLLSATHLVNLALRHIPHSGYFSPEAMATVLSASTSLENLVLDFFSPRSCPDRENRRSPPAIRSILPVLTYFRFKGTSEYLDDLVARIDTPELNDLLITFFNDVEFDTPQFMQFISRTPMSRSLEWAHITLGGKATRVTLSRASGHGYLHVNILCTGLDWQVSSLGQVCTSCMPPLSMSENLHIYKSLGWRLDNIENGPWVELLRPFTAVKNLYLGEEIAPRIAPALQEVVEGRITEVLPILESIVLEGLESSGSVEEGISQFVAAREVAGHPITISHWDSQKEKTPTYFIG